MRRLVQNTRNDEYGSRKDYQNIIKEDTYEYIVSSDNDIVLFYENLGIESEFVGIEAYFKSDETNYMSVNIFDDSNNNIGTNEYVFEDYWKRFGFAWINDKASEFYRIELKFSNSSIKAFNLNVSGFDRLINSQDSTEIELEKLNAPHLSPEAYYLPQNQIEINGVDEIVDSSDYIELKKCCYCQRYLLIGSLDSSFHKHAAKVSGYQNECRACKKFRINDTLNLIRTTDQLNESSVITREKKILLKEPQILKEIKDRHSGEGLKSITWKKFGKKCFNCNKTLRLKEVQLDHTRPLAYLWPLDEYATCLCSDCNNSKHDKFPIEFYKTREKIQELSNIIGLDIELLLIKEVNQVELKKIVENIVFYYEKLDLKTFKSIRNKVLKLETELDLYDILKTHSEPDYKQLIIRLQTRIE